MVTIIIPVYNHFKGVPASVLNAKTPKEILLINDGSTDDSLEKCMEYSKKNSCVKVIDKPHTGVSDTRNTGIKNAQGKYLLFLDSDDDLKPGSVENLVKFFDRYSDVTDLVTYPIETIWHGWTLLPHFRYKTLTHNGVYSLNDFPYMGQTTMNIMVKNLGKDNVLFDTSMSFEEDQDYCCRVLKRKMRMGFCKDAVYWYYRSEDSSSGRLNGACYIFEQATTMFEHIFSNYENKSVPLTFQGLYINDLAWKLRSDILYPYHYKSEEFEKANLRLKTLLDKVDNEVILQHPAIEMYHKYYWISQKTSLTLKPFFTDQGFGLKDISTKREIFFDFQVKLLISKIRSKENGNIFIIGCVRNPVFYFTDKPEIIAVINGKSKILDMFESAYSYHLCHTKTNPSYAFELETELPENISFKVKMKGFVYSCILEFVNTSPIQPKLNRLEAAVGKSVYALCDDKTLVRRDASALSQTLKNSSSPLIPFKASQIRKKSINLKKRRSIYLYSDCRGVEKDNGYYRFLEDFNKNLSEGHISYYICDPKNLPQEVPSKLKKYFIPFGSKKHKQYFLASEKVFAAYIEDNNLFPFPADELSDYSDCFPEEIIYLGHGTLHIVMPWKYSPEKIFADRVQIATDFEKKIFLRHNFRLEDLIVQNHSRWSAMSLTSIQPKNILLFAPSWRQYLVGNNIDGVWQSMDDRFKNSDYYKNICAFLQDEALKNWLKTNGFIICFRLHPIFTCYKKFFTFLETDYIRLVDRDNPLIAECNLLLTDFSSIAFDFHNMNRPVYSYIPDREQFLCGMNAYREIEPESLEMMISVDSAEKFVIEIDKTFERKEL